MRLAGKLFSLGVALFVLMPFVPIILWSFSHQWFYPRLIPHSWGVRAWEYVFGVAGAQIMSGLVQSVLIAAATAVVSIVLGTPAGRMLGLYNFRGKHFITVLLLLPIIVPPLSVAMGLHLWFIRLGLTESFLGVVLIHLTFCLPYAVFVMWGVFTRYNTDYEDQARSLGASHYQIVVRIRFPFIRNGVVVAGLFAFLLSWSQYLSTLIIGGGRITTLPILLFALMGSGDRPVAAAVSLVFILPAFVALIVSTRYLGYQKLAGI